MKDASFKEVLWTDGNVPKAETVRVIGAFPSAPLSSVNAAKGSKKPTTAALETVVYKKLGHTEMNGDVYYPTGLDTPTQKMPIDKFPT